METAERAMNLFHEISYMLFFAYFAYFRYLVSFVANIRDSMIYFVFFINSQDKYPHFRFVLSIYFIAILLNKSFGIVLFFNCNLLNELKNEAKSSCQALTKRKTFAWYTTRQIRIDLLYRFCTRCRHKRDLMGGYCFLTGGTVASGYSILRWLSRLLAAWFTWQCAVQLSNAHVHTARWFYFSVPPWFRRVRRKWKYQIKKFKKSSYDFILHAFSAI